MQSTTRPCLRKTQCIDLKAQVHSLFHSLIMAAELIATVSRRSILIAPNYYSFQR